MNHKLFCNLKFFMYFFSNSNFDFGTMNFELKHEKETCILWLWSIGTDHENAM